MLLRGFPRESFTKNKILYNIYWLGLSKDMKFSIIIPAFNSENTIKRALCSVQNQSFGDFEVLIIDDGSTDNTAKICKDFTGYDKRFKYHFQTNKGVSAARNYGISIATGEFLLFLDSDDAYLPNYLSVLNEVITLHSDCDNFWFDYETVENNLSFVDTGNTVTSPPDVSELNRNNTTILPALWNKAFRKRIIDKTNLRMPEDLSLGEDFIFNYCYLDVSGEKIIHINEKLYLYTKANNSSLDGKYRSNLADIFEILENEMFSHFKKWNVTNEQFLKYYQYVFYNRIKLLYETYRVECQLDRKEKHKRNKAILKSPKFREALNNATWYINPLYKFAYIIASWRFIQFLDILVKTKGRIN